MACFTVLRWDEGWRDRGASPILGFVPVFWCQLGTQQDLLPLSGF
jgi:hypothetical protein